MLNVSVMLVSDNDLLVKEHVRTMKQTNLKCIYFIISCL